MSAEDVKQAPLLIQKYVELRDEVDALDKAHKARVAPLNDIMEKIELALGKILQDTGLENLKAEAGTASPVVKTSVSVASWDETFNFIRENHFWHFLNKAVAKASVEEYMKENGNIPPPGVNYTSFRTVQIRRARTSTKTTASE